MKISNTKIAVALIIILSLSLVCQYYLEHLKTTDIIVKSLRGKLPERVVQSQIERGNAKFSSSIILSPLYVTLKIALLSLVVFSGYYLLKDKKEEFKVIFFSGIIAESVVVISKFTKVFAISSFYQDELTLQKIDQYAPLSMVDIVGLNHASFEWLLALKYISLFNIFYLFVFSYMISRFKPREFSESSFVVIVSLTSCVILYILLAVLFFTIF
jgi:hypothetical protein